MMKTLRDSIALVGALAMGLTTPASASQANDPGRFRAEGEVTAVDAAGSTFLLHTRQGEALTIAVNAETEFQSPGGDVGGLEDLQPGALVRVVGAVLEDGTHLARHVAVGKAEADRDRNHPEVKRFRGRVESVNADRGTFTILSRGGRKVTFQTSPRTQFKSRDGSVQSLKDLKVGMIVDVAAARLADGGWMALTVFVGEAESGSPRPRPGGELRAAGQIAEIGTSSFTIKSRGDGALTFHVTDATAFKSRDGGVDSFDDLRVGMSVVVTAKKSADGQLQALLVAVEGSDNDSEGNRPAK